MFAALIGAASSIFTGWRMGQSSFEGMQAAVASISVRFASARLAGLSGCSAGELDNGILAARIEGLGLGLNVWGWEHIREA